MLHLYFKWRYQKKSRAGAFKLPKQRTGVNFDGAHFVSYLSQDSVRGRGLKPFDLPRKRRKWMQLIVTIAGISLLFWIAYESIVALALLGN